MSSALKVPLTTGRLTEPRLWALVVLATEDRLGRLRRDPIAPRTLQARDLGAAVERLGLPSGVGKRVDPEGLQVAMDLAQETSGAVCKPWQDAVRRAQRSRARDVWFELCTIRLRGWRPLPSDPPPPPDPDAYYSTPIQRGTYCRCGWFAVYPTRTPQTPPCPACGGLWVDLPSPLHVAYDPREDRRWFRRWTVPTGQVLRNKADYLLLTIEGVDAPRNSL